MLRESGEAGCKFMYCLLISAWFTRSRVSSVSNARVSTDTAATKILLTWEL